MAGTPNKHVRYLRFSSVGLELGAAVVGGMFLGQWLDGRFGTAPWLMIVFLALGMAAGFRSIFRLLKSLDAPEDRGQDAPLK